MRVFAGALVLVAACSVDVGKDNVLASGEGGVVIDRETQKVTLDPAKVPVLPACAQGQAVVRTADGWECLSQAALKPAWDSVQSKPSIFPTTWSAVGDVDDTTVWPGRVALDRVDGASDAVAALSQQLNALQTALQAVGGGAIGDVVTSVLPEAAFRTIRGTGWILADGRDVSGSAYATLTGKTKAPDLRGIFLRGANDGRSDGSQNPDGGTDIGAAQADIIKAHSHAASASLESPRYPSEVWDNQYNTRFDAASNPYEAYVWYNTSDTRHTHTITVANTGGNETRPRNVTVRFFVRIN